jgi:endonuclease/exonuclease/phosphatase (EEP) superfamily protein YafD
LKETEKKTKKLRPKRPLAHVIRSVRQVLKITKIADEESIWQWGEARLEALPQVIDIAIWNIWKASGGEGFLREYQKICHERHMILCQEALLTLKGLGHFAPNGFVANHGGTYKRMDGLRDGVMTVSAAKPGDGARRVLCLTPEPVLRTPKATLITTYKIAGCNETLCVVNTHATLIRRPSTAVREIEQVIDHIAGHKGPLLYAGDFNTFTSAYMTEVDRVLSTIGLERVRFDIDPRASTAALDQLYTRDIGIIKAVVDTSYVKSDHFPIIARLNLAGSSKTGVHTK